jgi:hypothetical protein
MHGCDGPAITQTGLASYYTELDIILPDIAKLHNHYGKDQDSGCTPGTLFSTDPDSGCTPATFFSTDPDSGCTPATLFSTDRDWV